MSSQTPYPEYQSPQLSGYDIGSNLGTQGTDWMNQLNVRKNQGIDPYVMEQWKGSNAYARNLAQTNALRAMKEQTAGRMLPTGSVIRPMNELYSNLNANQLAQNKEMSIADWQAKQQNFTQALQGYMGLQGLSSSIAGNKNYLSMQDAMGKNNWNQKRWEIEEQNRFKWGDALGGLFGVAGDIGGMFLGMPPGLGSFLGGGSQQQILFNRQPLNLGNDMEIPVIPQWG